MKEILRGDRVRVVLLNDKEGEESPPVYEIVELSSWGGDFARVFLSQKDMAAVVSAVFADVQESLRERLSGANG